MSRRKLRPAVSGAAGYFHHRAILCLSAALLAGAPGAVTPAMAQSTQSTTKSFSIPAGSLTSALNSFAAQSGLQILFDASLANGKSTTGASGSLTPNQALSNILAGTGITYRYTGQSTITLDGPGSTNTGANIDGAIALDTIDVGGGQSSAANADTPYETPGSTSFITSSQIERFPSTTAGDIFKNTPGVISAMNHNGSSIDVNIRGMQGMNRVKVTIDGTQQTTSTWRGYLGADDRTYVDPDFISGVSIEKGPAGGAAGAGANAGVVEFSTIGVNDILLPGKTEGVRLRMGTNDNATSNIRENAFDQSTDAPGLLDFENKTGSAAFAATRENFDVLVAVAKRKRGNYFAGKNGPTEYRTFDGWASPLSYTKPGEEVFNSSEESFSALAKATIRLDEEQTLDIGYQRFSSMFGETIGSMLVTGDHVFRQLPLAHAEVDTYTARYRWNPQSDLIDLRANAWATDVQSRTVSVGPAVYVPPFLTPEMRPPARDTRYSETWTYGADISNTSLLDTAIGNLKLGYGAAYTLEDTKGRPYLSARGYATEIGVPLQGSVGTREVARAFLDGEWKASEWLKFNGGLRYDYFSIEDKGGTRVWGSGNNVHTAVYADKSGSRLNPMASVTVTPLDGLQFYAQYEEGFRPPSLRETIGSDSTLAPNPALEPELAKNWEFGVNYLKDGLLADNDKTRFKFAYFRNSYENYIARVPNPNIGPGLPFYSVDNIATARFNGFEAMAEYDIGYFFAQASLTYYTDFEFCKTKSICASANLPNDYAANHLPPEISRSLTLGVRLFDEKLVVGGRVIDVGKRMGPLPVSAQQTNFWVPYTVYDGFASYEFNDNTTFSLNVENLTNRYYVDALNGWMPSPGRTVRLGMTAKF
ncbi:hypothetical protein C6Y62_02210 [Hyphomicrobium sulfonivorans]|nr:hypothetical protein [Hyphomicrobium sulfonivorans]